MTGKKIKQEIRTIKRMVSIAERRLNEGSYKLATALLYEVANLAEEIAKRIAPDE